MWDSVHCHVCVHLTCFFVTQFIFMCDSVHLHVCVCAHMKRFTPKFPPNCHPAAIPLHLRYV